MVNQHGLSRDIPASVARQVRQECGFGCVLCGNAFYDYHHIEPKFEDAKTHDPACIALLCRGCHGNVPHFLSNEAVWEGRRNPHCLSKGFSFGPLDVGARELHLALGRLEFVNPRSLVRIHNEEILKVEPPEEKGGPIRLSATFYDVSGNVTARIDKNQLVLVPESWDVTILGNELVVRRGPGDIALKLYFTPRKGLYIDRLHMLHQGVSVDVKNDIVTVGNFQAQVNPSNIVFMNCKSCIVVTKEGMSFGEEIGPNVWVAHGHQKFAYLQLPSMYVPDGSSIVLECCTVAGGIRLEGSGRLEASVTAVVGTNPKTLPPMQAY